MRIKVDRFKMQEWIKTKGADSDPPTFTNILLEVIIDLMLDAAERDIKYLEMVTAMLKAQEEKA
jgi:hypothetical protein|tara:strand:+ start:469 stop:660 length:192 start_codon:yes stop_codon:yes gene_type:complete